MSGKRPRKWARRIRRLLLVGAGGLLVLFLGLQVLLETPWMRGQVGKALTARTGLEVSMTDLGWTPWAGASVEGMVVEQPRGVRELTDEPLLKLHSVRVFPDYAACLRKQWRVRRIEVDRPELVVSLEMLVSIVASGLSPTQPPAIAVVEGLKPPPVVPNPGPPVSGLEVSPRPGLGGPKDPQSGAEMEEPKEAVTTSLRPLEIEIQGATLRCLSVSHSLELWRVGGLSCDLPIGIEGCVGGCQIQEVTLLGEVIETNVQIDISSEADVVRAQILESTEKESQLIGDVQVKLVKGLPFQAVVQYDGMDLLSWQVSGLGEVAAPLNQTLVQGGGWLLAPMTWQGLCRFQGAGIEVRDQGLRFDRYGGSLLLERGILKAPDIRFLGDQFALLGNGWISSSDGAGVLRLVVPEGAAGLVQQRLGSEPLEALGPGNRRFVDIEFWREPKGWVTDVTGGTTPLAELWASEGLGESLANPGVPRSGR